VEHGALEVVIPVNTPLYRASPTRRPWHVRIRDPHHFLSPRITRLGHPDQGNRVCTYARFGSLRPTRAPEEDGSSGASANVGQGPYCLSSSDGSAIIICRPATAQVLRATRTLTFSCQACNEHTAGTLLRGATPPTYSTTAYDHNRIQTTYKDDHDLDAHRCCRLQRQGLHSARGIDVTPSSSDVQR